ncbi:NADH-quinone oxidoreductase subunit J [Paracoccaceae bacterium GXU_MW_L88]
MIVFTFYLFALTAIIGALMTVTSKNPVHSVLWLILTFFSAAGLFLTMGAEFVAMLLVIVYVGAVAVLFLFVVMMLDVDFAELRKGATQYLPIGLMLGLVILAELLLVMGVWQYDDEALANLKAPVPDMLEVNNIEAIGTILYTDYVLLFQLAGLILFVAMIGAIVLTLRTRDGVKRQDVMRQIYRDPKEAMEIKDVKPGQGLS